MTIKRRYIQTIFNLIGREENNISCIVHCVKNFQIRSFFWFLFSRILPKYGKIRTAWKLSKYGVFSGPYFRPFGLDTERYEVSLRMQSECAKIRIRKNSEFGQFSRSDAFYAVVLSVSILCFLTKSSNIQFPWR